MKKIHLHLPNFTIIELLVVLMVIVIAGAIALTNVRTIRSQNRDTESKSDINALYFQLETFYEENNYYPLTLDKAVVFKARPEIVTDVNGAIIGDKDSAYSYNPEDCTGKKCESFELSSELEREATYIKRSLH